MSQLGRKDGATIPGADTDEESRAIRVICTSLKFRSALEIIDCVGMKINSDPFDPVNIRLDLSRLAPSPNGKKPPQHKRFPKGIAFIPISLAIWDRLIELKADWVVWSVIRALYQTWFTDPNHHNPVTLTTYSRGGSRPTVDSYANHNRFRRTCSTLPHTNARSYMKEAVDCYRIGTYCARTITT
jgi:hypothetical protein